MYILQICNTISQEILVEQKFENPYNIESLIDSFNDWREWFISDNGKRKLKGSYVNHSIIKDGDNTIYKVSFNVKFSKLPEVEKTVH